MLNLPSRTSSPKLRLSTPEASKVLDKYIEEVIEKGLDNLTDNGSDISYEDGLEVIKAFEDILASMQSKVPPRRDLIVEKITDSK